jgi:hypothetical protein
VAPSLTALGSSGSGIEISLAEWSLHRALYGGRLDHLDFPAKAKKEFGISAVESLGRLGVFAEPMKINIVAENHGGVTSNGAWLADVVKQVGLSNVGTLADFGNFCISKPWGSTQDGCANLYDRYKGVAELLPYAKGVSAKTYDFDANGAQPLMDCKRLIGLVKTAGYKGYIGIEFEGNTQPEEEGICKTKALLEKYL